MTDHDINTIAKLIVMLFVLGGLVVAFVLTFRLLRDQRRELRGLDGFARGLKRIRDDEKRMDPSAPSVLRVLAPTKHLGED